MHFLLLGGDKLPSHLSSHIIAISARIVSLFLVPAYSGAILSFILLPIIKLPFFDIKGLVEDGSYQIVYSNRSSMYVWFQVSHLF